MRRAWMVLLPLGASVAALAALQLFAPRYLLHQGFPLDDSWIHAVYAREWARGGMLAYNPGIPATGETSFLWAVLLGVLYRIADWPAAVVLTKVAGFVLHAAAAVTIGFALQPLFGTRRWLVWASAALAAAHPNLVVASVSGMEVPFATFVIALAIAASVRGRTILLAVIGAIAIGARPEIPVIVAAFPFLFRLPSNPRRALLDAVSAAAGGTAALGLLAIRNHAISGRLLPATFYAKANSGSLLELRLQQVGFGDLLGSMPLVGVPIVLGALAVVALLLLTRFGDTDGERAAAALFVSGIIFCIVLFALIPPIDPWSFYHQRYLLPGVFVMVTSMPLLIDVVVARAAPGVARAVAAIVVVAFGAVMAAAWPARAARLANDTRNIDDVQVALGKSLSSAPATDVVWAVDAGAVRFFGSAFVVDTVGLNTPEMLDDDRQRFLDRHEPRFLDYFPTWSEVQNDAHATMRSRTFETSTEYTVAINRFMRTHVLVYCEPPGLTGRMIVRGRVLAFRCAS